jgi:formylglycine-generating enzyme required for sulfatase activity
MVKMKNAILFLFLAIIFVSARSYAQDNIQPIPPEGMVYVPAGVFIMGSEIGDHDEKPQHLTATSAFFIHQYEISIKEYLGFDPSFKYSKGQLGNAVIVNWEQANNYCKWAEARLPTEKEWEKAARGTDGRLFPWGNTFNESFVAWDYTESRGGSIAKPASPYGCYDMAGSVWEWTADWYKPYPGNSKHIAEYGEKYKVMRGGSNFNDWSFYITSHRYYLHPIEISRYPVGFRCVKDL